MMAGDARGAVLRQEGRRDACTEGWGSPSSGCNGLGYRDLPKGAHLLFPRMLFPFLKALNAMRGPLQPIVQSLSCWVSCYDHSRSVREEGLNHLQ